MWRHRSLVSVLLMLVSSALSSNGFLTDTQQNQNHQHHRQETICVWDKRDGEGHDKAKKIMYNQQSKQREAMRYQIIASEACEPLARRMEEVRVTCWIGRSRSHLGDRATLTASI
jgi:hypothetical protein